MSVQTMVKLICLMCVKCLNLLLRLLSGLFLIVINGFLLWLFAYIVDVAAFQNVTLSFPNLGSYAIGGLVFGLINWAERLILKD